MNSLDHQGIMKATQFSESETSMFIVMDLMGDDLRNLILNNSHPFEENFARYLFQKMIDAVKYAHQKHVVHCDIKLENFLVDIQSEQCDGDDDDSQQELMLKLTDFGMSSIVWPGQKAKGQ